MSTTNDQTDPANSALELDDVRRFTWAAEDVAAKIEKASRAAVALMREVASARQQAESATATATAARLAREGVPVRLTDSMNALHAERLAMTAALRATIGEADAIRRRLWRGALMLGLAAGVAGGISVGLAWTFVLPWIVKQLGT